jgi:hypothetical protein
MLHEKSSALGKSHWMGIRMADAAEFRAGQRNQIVADAEKPLAFNRDFLSKQQVIVLGHGASEGILDWNHGGVGRAAGDRVKGVRGKHARQKGCLRIRPKSGLVAEGARFSLDGNQQRRRASTSICIATATRRSAERTQLMDPAEVTRSGKERLGMLWTLFVILLVAWLIGLVGFHILAWYIHILLVLALVVLIIQLISGRRPVV